MAPADPRKVNPERRLKISGGIDYDMRKHYKRGGTNEQWVPFTRQSKFFCVGCFCQSDNPSVHLASKTGCAFAVAIEYIQGLVDKNYKFRDDPEWFPQAEVVACMLHDFSCPLTPHIVMAQSQKWNPNTPFQRPECMKDTTFVKLYDEYVEEHPEYVIPANIRQTVVSDAAEKAKEPDDYAEYLRHYWVDYVDGKIQAFADFALEKFWEQGEFVLKNDLPGLLENKISELVAAGHLEDKRPEKPNNPPPSTKNDVRKLCEKIPLCDMGVSDGDASLKVPPSSLKAPPTTITPPKGKRKGRDASSDDEEANDHKKKKRLAGAGSYKEGYLFDDNKHVVTSKLEEFLGETEEL